MALEAFETGDGNMWLASGGDWFFDLNDSEQQEAIDLLLKFHHLPHIIEITNDNIKYAIAHADYPGSEYLFGKEIAESGNDSNLLIVFYVQIMPDDFVMQLHRF